MSTRTLAPAGPHADFPALDRIHYFYGLMLGANDFETEQRYFRERLKLHNRCLHGYGTVCGLWVTVPKPAPACAGDPDKPVVVIEPGLALDAEGNELIVPRTDHGLKVDLWSALSDDDKRAVLEDLGDDKEADYSGSLYVLLHHHEYLFEPTSPILPDPCSGARHKQCARIRDGVAVTVTTEKPPDDHRCETCCHGHHAHRGLLLARVDRFNPWRGLEPDDVHNEVRRRISTYPLTTITGVNWRHGCACYPRHGAHHLLREGLVVHFSRPVLAETIRRGVIDVYHVEARSTRHPNIIELRGEIVPCDEETTTSLRYRVMHMDEHPEPGDRLMVVVRCGFILDACCRPVDGLNVGGRVPYVDEAGRPMPDDRHPAEPCARCLAPPWSYGPWTSGNGTGGGTFESWFYVEEGAKA